jgi:hypothetical protein
MAEKTDRTLDAHRLAREQQRRVTASTAIGLNALKPVMQFQVSMLRLWAKNIERFAGNYENGVVPLSRNTRNRNGPLEANFANRF